MRLTCFILILLVKQIWSQCATGCQTCTAAKNCIQCKQGYFLVGGTNCIQCPATCPNYCVTNIANNQPLCTNCTAPAVMGSSGFCIYCAPSCLTCSSISTNCTSCRDRLTFRTVNSTGQCIKDPACPFDNCNVCAKYENSFTYCSVCSKGYFNFRQGCFKCPYPCKKCSSQNITDVWNDLISQFWVNLIQRTYNVNSLNDLSWLFSNSGDFQNMNISLIYEWTQAFFLYQALQPNLVSISNSTLQQMIQKCYQIISSGMNSNLTFNNIRINVYTYINQVLNINWSITQYQTRIGLQAAKFTTCSQCPVEGFYLNSTLASCELCRIQCKRCPQGKCTVCEAGYYYQNSTCRKCSSQCLECSSFQNCTKCSYPFALLDNTCVLCNWPCQTCTSNKSQCITCKKPFSLVASVNTSTCYRCSQDQCNICVQTNKAICLECSEGNSLLNGICSACPSSCSSCLIIKTAIICYSCYPGYILINNTCVVCGPGCLTCLESNINFCVTCLSGMEINVMTGKCQLCPSDCRQCVEGVCSRVAAGALNLGGVYIKCFPGCRRCNSTYPDKCLQCLPSYMLSNGICKKCEFGCEFCNSISNCTKCLNDYILSNGNCLACQGSCLTCNATNISQCFSCKYGYSLLEGRCYNNCGTGCLSCNSSSFCQLCDFGFGLRSDGLCIKCLYNCTGRCDPYNITNCLQCGDGFQNLNNFCVACPSGCSKCFNGQCTSCFQGYSLIQTSSNFICTDSCLYPCLTCSYSECLSCHQGYALNNGQCLLDIQCSPNCLNCPAGTFRYGTNSCVSCSNNCASCTDSTNCLACMQGFQITVQNTCIACPTNCRTCSDGYCYLCPQPGFYRQVSTLNKGIADATYGSKCLSCSNNCMKCYASSKKCASCNQSSQKLMSNRCCGLYTVRYEYETLTGYNKFISNSRSELFLTSVASMTGTGYEDNYFMYIMSGSTIFGGAISAANSQDATYIQGLLTTSIPGEQIISLTSYIYYNDSKVEVTPPNKPANLGLIIGVVIGGCVLIAIGIIIAYCILKRKKQAQKIDNTENKKAQPLETSSQKQLDEQYKMHI